MHDLVTHPAPMGECSPIKLLMVEPLEDGGIAHYAFNLARALERKGVATTLFTGKNYELGKDLADVTVLAHMFRMAGGLTGRFRWLSCETGLPAALRRLVKLAEYPFNTLEAAWVSRRQDAKVVHFQTVNLTELPMIAAFKMLGRKIVYTIHNVRPRHGNLKGYQRVLYRLTYSLCNHLIIHSEAGKAEVVDLFSVAPRKISVIPHGDYKFFLQEKNTNREPAKAALGLPPASRTLLFFGAIRPSKGLDLLLRAVSLARAKIPDIRLLIVGEPYEDFRKYQAIIEQEGLQGCVLLELGYVPNEEVSRYFQAADVVVLPYREISQSGVLQIAYAFGKPVVATAVGGFVEAVEDGKNGFLVPPGDIDLLADRIVEILADEARMERMGRCSRHMSDSMFSWDEIAGRTIDVYRQVLAT